MLVSLKWLKDYVDIDLNTRELSDKLTMAGLEVDSIKEVAPGFSGVVVARVLSVRPHPNADKLSLCEVSTGDKTVPVVCGAPNVRSGILSAFAKVGANIPGGYTIKSTKLRGELSEGMLCSEEELGIGDDAGGIMVLPEGLTPGEDLASAMKLTDTVLDIGITPNRSDCLCMIGIAREIAAVTGRELRYPHIAFTESEEDISRLTSVRILDPDLCPRYTARMIRNISIGPSPSWIRTRLEAVGLRSINNIVDITNFVMMEFGQPLHAFDFRYLAEGRIVVRRAGEGEEFVSLDGKSRTLSSDALMICDGSKPVAVAGIMGGLNSEVQDDTKTVFLESAYFSPASIRRTSKKLGMGTDAAFRFERGIDPEGVVRALERAAQLTAELSGGSVVKGYIDQYPRKIENPKVIALRPARIREILGVSISDENTERILRGLEMDVERKGSCFSVTAPTFRVDISTETDLVEEVARLHGYERIPETLPQIKTRPEDRQKEETAERYRKILTGCGFTEVIHYSFTNPASADILGLKGDDERRRFIRIINPLAEDCSVMRTTLIYGLLDTMKKNLNVGNTDIRMFERGRIFIARAEGELPLENEKLCGLLTGTRFQGLLHGKELADFFDLKGCVESLLEGLRFNGVRYIASGDQPFLHPGRACRLEKDGRDLGFIGEIHPAVLERLDVKGKTLVFELDFDFSRPGLPKRSLSGRFPVSHRVSGMWLSLLNGISRWRR